MVLDAQGRQRQWLLFRFEQSNAALDLKLDIWMIAHEIAELMRFARGEYLARQLV